MFNVNVVTELESADQGRGDIGAQTGLVSDQLLQTSDGEGVLGADVHCSCRATGSECSILSMQGAHFLARLASGSDDDCILLTNFK